MNYRLLIPRSARQRIRLFGKTLRDFFTGETKKFTNGKDPSFFSNPFCITVSQPIMPGKYLENKVHNIRIGVAALEHIVLMPGQVFSFWNLVPEPSQKNNYRIGRNLVWGKVCTDYGGGICQLSGIIYHVSLMAGLSVTERHNHSFDIYKEHERFTPLGADAAVVYGSKDLRVRNDYSFPVGFNFKVTANELVCSVVSVQKLEPLEIVFEKEIRGAEIKVLAKTLSGKSIGTSVYGINSRPSA